MKKIVLFLTFLILSTAIGYSQIVQSSTTTFQLVNKEPSVGNMKAGFKGFVDAGPLYDMEYKALGYDVDIILGYQFSHNFFIGMGSGLLGFNPHHDLGDAEHTSISIPIYFDGRCYFFKSALKLFVDFKIGGLINVKESYICGESDYQRLQQPSGLYLSTGVGLEYKWMDISFSWYGFNEVYYNKYLDDEDLIGYRSRNHYHMFDSSLSLKLGINF